MFGNKIKLEKQKETLRKLVLHKIELLVKNPSFSIAEDEVLEYAMEIRLASKGGTSKGITPKFNAEADAERT